MNMAPAWLHEGMCLRWPVGYSHRVGGVSQDTDESCTHHVGCVVENAGGYIPCYTSVQALWEFGARFLDVCVCVGFSGCVCVDIQCFIVRVSVIIGLPFNLTGVDHTSCDMSDFRSRRIRYYTSFPYHSQDTIVWNQTAITMVSLIIMLNST